MTPHAGVQIIGHRGAAGHGPENTEAALLAGIRLGAHALEVDIQFTADGVPVLCHDRTLERTAGVKGRIREQTARELSGYDIGFRSGPDFRGLRLLTLDEACALVPPGVDLHLEIKDYDAVTAAHLKEMVHVLRRRGGLERCLITSFSEAVLKTARSVDAHLHTGLLVAGRPRGAAARAAALGCRSVHPEAGTLERGFVEECEAEGLKIFPYTVNEPARMKALVMMGVDGIYTDYPGRLAETLGADAARDASPRPRNRRGAAGRQAAGALPPQETPIPAVHPAEPLPPADAEADAADPLRPGETEAARARRRRGKRGGRRHRKGAAAIAPPPEPGDEIRQAEPEGLPAAATPRRRPIGAGHAVPAPALAEPEPIEIEGDEGSLPPPPLLGDPAFEGDAEPDEGAAPGTGAEKKKRRRGKRGGRKQRERMQRKSSKGPARGAAGEASGAPDVTGGLTGSDADDV